MEYKKKFKLKLKSLPKPKVSKEYGESMKMISPESDKVTPAKTEGPKLVIKKKKPKKKDGVIYRKGNLKKVMSGKRMNAEIATEKIVKDKMEEMRYGGELQIKKKIKRLK